MSTKITFIYAASASGKTTWIESFPKTQVPFAGITSDISTGPEALTKYGVASAGEAILVDGDQLIQSQTRWPTNSGWWQGEDGKHIAFSNVLSIFTMLQRLSLSKPAHIIVLWNGAIWPIPRVDQHYGDYWQPVFGPIDYRLVEIPESTHKEYVEARIKNDKNPGTGSFHGFPRNWRDAQNNRISLRKDFDLLGGTRGRLYSSFDEAIPDDIDLDAERELVHTSEHTESSFDDNWTLEFSARGYKDSDPPNGGSTRIVWKSNETPMYMVMKLFDDGGTFPEEPRTIKFWKTSDFKSDYMKWASSKHRFEPTPEEMVSFQRLRDELLSEIRNIV